MAQSKCTNESSRNKLSTAERECLARKIILGFWLVMLVSIYSIPENVFTLFPSLKSYVDFLSSIFPSVAAFGEYSSFPQVAQLLYSIGILSLPFLALPMKHAVWVCDLRSTKIIQKISRLKLMISLLLAVIVPIAFLFYFPWEPNHLGGVASRFSAWVCNSKIGFSVGSTIALLSSLVLFIILANFVWYFQKHLRC